MNLESGRIARLLQQINRDSYNQAAHMALGREYMTMGRWMEAAAAFRRATELNSQGYEAWQRMGEAYENAGVEKEALSAFRHAVHVAGYLGNTKGAEYSQGHVSRLEDAAA
jgi:uncharacterized protein HemY